MAVILKNSTSETIYKSLKDDILHLILPPGSAISETETASKYNVSRTPIRDVFKSLEKEGLLEVKPHIGTFISLIDMNKISNIIYMREVLEASILKDLCLSSTPFNLLKCRLILEEQKKLLTTDLSDTELGKIFIGSDNEFHRSLFNLAGKDGIWLYLCDINQQYERFRTLSNLEKHENMMKLYNDHIAILDLIEQKNIEKLYSTIKQHIYWGFNRSSEVIYKYPDYFKPIS